MPKIRQWVSFSPLQTELPSVTTSELVIDLEDVKSFRTFERNMDGFTLPVVVSMRLVYHEAREACRAFKGCLT